MSAKPLADIRVVDLSRHLPGPFAARILRDLGARVIKVEEPTVGDPVRLVKPVRGGAGALAAALLAGVESIALDLRQDGARDVLVRLLSGADVLLESSRPGGLERLTGAGPAEMAARYPRLVVCSISGFGQTGPARLRTGHDLSYQALAGSLSPVDGMPALPAADLLGGWSAATAILAALVERGRTGRGSVIDAPLLDAAGHGNLMAWVEEVQAEHGVGEALPLTGAYPCYNVYATSDGRRVAVACLEPVYWKRFCKLVGRRDLLLLQYDRDSESRRQVAAVIATRTRQEWQELFEANDLPAESVLSAAESRAHPQVIERGLLREGADGLPRLAYPALIDGERPRAHERLPKLGEDTDTILAELGCPEAELGRRARRAAGIGRRRTLKGMLWRLASSSND
jgi:crotonobetainyl-CoA:carnitine CoA-transferase CaiB-like acyl-CoA transferase